MAQTPSNFSALLLDHSGHHSTAVATCLGQVPGCRLHIVSNARWPAVRLSRFAASFRQFSDTENESAQLEEILRVSREVKADVLLPVTEAGIQFTAQNRGTLAGEIKLPPLPSPEAIETVINKFSLARWLGQNGFPTPETFLYTSITTAKKDLKQLRFPVLLKPIVGGNGIGIRRFDQPGELLAALHSSLPEAGFWILQSYVRGRDVDCSVLCHDGKILAHTMQTGLHPRRNPFAVDGATRFAPHAAAFAQVEKTMAAIHWNGIAHLDMREDERDGRIHTVDFTVRFWATLLGSLAAGVNFPHLACLSALGIEFSPPISLPTNYFTASAALKKLNRLAGCKTGLPYILSDPVPRAMNLFKRMVPC